MSKASYRKKQSRCIGILNQGPYPKRWITLKVYRKWRRLRHREGKANWRCAFDIRSYLGQHVECWPPVECRDKRRR